MEIQPVDKEIHAIQHTQRKAATIVVTHQCLVSLEVLPAHIGLSVVVGVEGTPSVGELHVQISQT